MERYLIMADNYGIVYTVGLSDSYYNALIRCKDYNEEVGDANCHFFVVRVSDGQTWNYKDGRVVKIVLHNDAVETKEVAI